MASSCEQLASEITALRAEIARIPRVDESALKHSIKSSLMPEISSAVTAAGVVITNKFQPQIDKAFGQVIGLSDAQKAAKIAADIAVKDAQAEAARVARDNFNKLSQTEREVRDAQYKANVVNRK